MDWNWFFSAVAQCSSAIVGIFGAFIITKVVNNQMEYKKRNNEFEQLITKSILLKNKTENRYFNWYNDQKRKEELKEIRRSIRDGNDILSPEEYYVEYNFSLYDDRNEILENIQNVIDNTNPHNQNLFFTDPSNNGQLYQDIQDEEEAINELKVDIINHTLKLENFLTQIKGNPQKSNLLTYSIISNLVLFLFGVIYPLSFLPIKDSINISFSMSNFIKTLFSVKGFMLTIIGLIFSGIMITFLFININLKHDRKLIKDIEQYSDIKNYSSYHNNFVTNKKFIGEYSESD